MNARSCSGASRRLPGSRPFIFGILSALASCGDGSRATAPPGSIGGGGAGGTGPGPAGGTGAASPETGGTAQLGGAGHGGATTGGIGTSGDGSGGAASAGGVETGGVETGGVETGGLQTGGVETGGVEIGGTPSGGGSMTGGTSDGGTSSGGDGTGGGGTGAATGGVETGGGEVGGTGAGGALVVPPGIVKTGEDQIALSGLTVVSYGGYLNGESFQQDAVVSFGGYQYTAFWNTNRNVVLARRPLPTSASPAPGAWEKFDFTDYTLSADDAHNTISLGIAPGDGTLHLAFDHHGSNLHYRRSVTGFLTAPDSASWAAGSFGPVSSALVGSATVTLVTYPRFVTEPGGARLLLSARIGESGSGDEHLWEYDAASHAWSALGEYIEGTDQSMNAYLHGLSYTRGGSRLHAAWCWRDTPDATTNHDLVYIYSDDHGRTWLNGAGVPVATSGATFVTRDSTGVVARVIGQDRGLINQEHMAVDASGRVHVLLSHLPDGAADDANFESARARSEFFHYVRDSDGSWTRHDLGLSAIANFRGKLAISSSENVYAILPDLRIAGAAPSSGYSWTLLDAADSGRFFSDPLIDTARLENSDELTVYYPERSSVNIWSLEYTLE